jgi:hypothetical protein
VEQRVEIAEQEQQSVEEHTPCFHCLDFGWVMLTAENDFGELEDYFVLCRRCKEEAA